MAPSERANFQSLVLRWKGSEDRTINLLHKQAKPFGQGWSFVLVWKSCSLATENSSTLVGPIRRGKLYRRLSILRCTATSFFFVSHGLKIAGTNAPSSKAGAKFYYSVSSAASFKTGEQTTCSRRALHSPGAKALIRSAT